MEKTNKNTTMGISLGLCFGSAWGVVFGLCIFHNLALGIGLGFTVCLCFGWLLGSAKDKRVNEQLEAEGYRIKKIKEIDIAAPMEHFDDETPVVEEGKKSKSKKKKKIKVDPEFEITIESKSGETKVIKMVKSKVDYEKLTAGEYVYLNEQNELELAYSKEDKKKNVKEKPEEDKEVK